MLSANTPIIFDKELVQEVLIFKQLILRDFSILFKQDLNKYHTNPNRISIELNPDYSSELGNEGYILEVDTSLIRIIGASKSGAFYGLQTLRQILMQSSTSNVEEKTYILQCLEIKDRPRFPWRGFMLDVSRHFFDRDVIMKLLDEMALLKMNVFHWHLTDDQGWRLPIAKYPELISIASKRDSSQIAVSKNEDGEKVFHFDGVPHEGFYTYEDIHLILQYASERHITVIPEIDMPSHNQAAMAAYSWLSTTGRVSTVPTVFFGEPYLRNPAEINISDTTVVNFFKNVLDETVELFPSDIIHIGGDEVWYELWAKSSNINNFIRKMGFKSYADLQMWFSTEMSKHLAGRGKRMMAWNDVLGGHLDKPDSAHLITVPFRPLKETIIGFWKGDQKLIEIAANQGYDVVNGNSGYTYFNFGSKALSLHKAYNFNPVPSDLTPEAAAKVLGTTCHLWTENVPNSEKLYSQLFPRIAASAEVGWTDASNKNFDQFSNGLKTLKSHWKTAGIQYGQE